MRKTPVTGAEADDGSQVICREKEGGKEIKDQMFSFAPFPPILPPLLTLFKENEVVVTFRKATPPPPPFGPATPPPPPPPLTQQDTFRIWNDVLRCGQTGDGGRLHGKRGFLRKG